MTHQDEQRRRVAELIARHSGERADAWRQFIAGKNIDDPKFNPYSKPGVDYNPHDMPAM